jgi:signal peptidase I
MEKDKELRIKESNRGSGYQEAGSFVWEIVKIVALAFIIIIPIRVFLFQPFFVQGASMEPNFEDKQYLIVNEFGYKKTLVKIAGSTILDVKPFKDIERQKVVVFRYPLDPSKFFIKRVIGLPGEKVEIREGKILIYNQENPDGFALDERQYLQATLRTNGNMSIALKSDEYFVMGDNRMFSSDSRSWGPVPEKDIVGKVLLRAWPLDKISAY